MSASKSTSCPEDANSTDCLLRLVLQALEERAAAEAEFNWDPLTFAVTVPIALIAAVFALVTSYQSALAAGPGRRKSNRRAIGPWAAKTRNEWSWRDLTRVSIATTPLLRRSDLIVATGAVVVELPGEDTEASSLSGVSRHSVDGHRNKVGGASWLSLLEYAGLGDLRALGIMQVQQTMADYLPGDLMAVPAYMDVGAIIAMTAAVGIQSIRVLHSDSGPYPVILGRGFQFDFRHHPTLGIIGAFTDYEKSGPKSTGSPKLSIPQKYQLAWSAMHATGRTATTLMRGLGQSAKGFFLTEGMKAMRSSILATRIPAAETKVYLHHECHPDPNRTNLCPVVSHGDDHHLIWLFCTSTPEHVPGVFPVQMTRCEHRALILLGLNSRFWSNPAMWTLRSGDRPASTRYSDTAPVILPQAKAYPDKSVFPHHIGHKEIRAITHMLEG